MEIKKKIKRQLKYINVNTKLRFKLNRKKIKKWKTKIIDREDKVKKVKEIQITVYCIKKKNLRTSKGTK